MGVATGFLLYVLASHLSTSPFVYAAQRRPLNLPRVTCFGNNAQRCGKVVNRMRTRSHHRHSPLVAGARHKPGFEGCHHPGPDQGRFAATRRSEYGQKPRGSQLSEKLVGLLFATEKDIGSVVFKWAEAGMG